MRLRGGRWSRARGLASAALLCGAVLQSGGCTSTRPAPPNAATARPVATRPPAVQPSYAVSSLANLPGWSQEDHAAALAAFLAGCRPAADPDMQAVCAEGRALGPVGDDAARAFLEAHLRPVILPGPGLLTGYFSPEYPARAVPEGDFTAALRPRPADMVTGPPTGAGGRGAPLQQGEDGRTWPYPDRAGVELTPAEDALAYLRPEDLFFLQVQGSGVLVFPDGRRLKATYAGDNGRPFVGIANPMVRAGYLQRDRASAGAIRAWLHAHAGAQAQAVMDLDPRYVFFQVQPDDGRDPAGSAGVALTAGRAIAVDPAWHAYGEPYWIDAAAPTLSGAVRSYRRLVMALDTGSAIRGDVRADLYLGRGERAGLEAGRVRHTLLLVRLLPRPDGRAVSAGGGTGEATPPPGGG